MLNTSLKQAIQPLDFDFNYQTCTNADYWQWEWLYEGQADFQGGIDELISLWQVAWPILQPETVQTSLLQLLNNHSVQPQLRVEVILVSDETIQAVNRDYRGKDQATDVVTFSLLGDAEVPETWLSLPQVDVGTIFLSVPWANAHSSEAFQLEWEELSKRYPKASERLTPTRLFLLDRLLHGMLHLMGQHHDTEEDYQRVVAIQRRCRQGVIQQIGITLHA